MAYASMNAFSWPHFDIQEFILCGTCSLEKLPPSNRVNCNHGHHDGRCGYKYVETVSDTVGFFRPPTGIVRDILVDVCRCEGDHS